jgi:radical SAM protein with 4Fe4S-binding SPASM domain
MIGELQKRVQAILSAAEVPEAFRAGLDGANAGDLAETVTIGRAAITVVLNVPPASAGKLELFRASVQRELAASCAPAKVTVAMTAAADGTDGSSHAHERTAADKIESPVRDRYNMDGHKLFWHLDRVAEWQAGKRVAPLHIDMGITTGCNMACTYCYGVIQGRAGFGTDKKGRFNMPFEAVTRTFDGAKAVGVRSVALIGEGENTLHPQFLDILDHGRKIGLDLSLATNAIRIDRDNLDAYLESLTWMRVNISAASEEGFLRVHQVPHRERIVENIRALTERKRQTGADCTIGMQMVVNKDDMDEIVPLARLGRQLGVDYLVIKSCSDTPERTLDAPDDEYPDIVPALREAESYATPDYVVSVKWHKLMNGGWKDYEVCYGTQFIMAISGSGNVFPCGHWFDVRSEEFRMGNVIETPFEEIVASDRYWDVQRRIQKVDVNRECETNCRQHYINRFLSGIAERPDHVNFV